MKNAILGIDFQNDFCRQSGALFVEGAQDDVVRFADFIIRNKKKIDYLSLTMDSHQVIDIAHPSMWVNVDGDHPNPYSLITIDDVRSGKWTPLFNPAKVIWYIEELEKRNRFKLVVWPEHCIIGTEGAAIHNTVMDAVKEWARQNKFFQIVQKGQFPLTEHYGALEAEVPFSGEPSTQMNHGFIKVLEKYDTIYLAGEARTHCVANTIAQLSTFPNLAKKIILLEDCMSNVPGGPVAGLTFATLCQPIYDQALNVGMKLMKSTDITI